MAVLPTRALEIEFDAGVWTDVTADLVELGSRRGRNRELGRYETGTMQFVVRNDGRKYDPDNTAGPYYGKLRPNRRVRFRATYNAVTYPVYVGYIDRISQEYGGPNDATAVFDTSDFFKILNRVELVESVYAATVADDAPLSWWKLDEPVGASTILSTTRQVGAVTGSPGFGAPGLVVRDPGSAVAFTPGPEIVLPAGTFPTTGSWSVEFWFTGAAVNNTILGHTARETASPAGLLIQTIGAGIGTLAVDQVVPGATTGAATSTSICDGSPHHVVIVGAAGSPLKIYVDGIDRTAGGAANTLAGFASGSITLNWGGGGNGNYTIDHLAFYDVALSAGQIAAHNSAGRTPWTGDLPGARLVRIFDLAGGGDYAIDDGVETLQATDLGGTALAYAQRVEETDAGALFVARDGTVTFLDRNTLNTGDHLTSKATIVDDDSGAGIPYRFTGHDVDEATIITRATVSREGSVAVTYYDAAAQAEFGWIDEVLGGLLHSTDDYSRRRAEWLVNTHKDPRTRVGTVTLALTKDPAAMYPAILGLEIGDRVTYKRKPQNTGAVMSLDMRVEAIAHETGGHYWNTQLQLSPINLGEDGYPVFVWDVTRWDEHVWGL